MNILPVSRFRVISAADILNQPVSSPLFEESLVVENGITGLYGEPGCGKTMFASNLMVAHLIGRPVLGLTPTQQGTGLYLDAEGTFRLRLRCSAYAAHVDPEQLPVFGLAGDLLDLHDAESVHAFIDAVRTADVRPSLTVIDTLPLHFGGDENGPDMNIGVRHMKEITAGIGGAIVVLLHPSKSRPDVERGHGSLRGAADYMLYAKRDGDAVTIVTSKDRFGAPGAVVGRYRICELPDIDRGAVLRPASEVYDDRALTTNDAIAFGAIPHDAAISYSDWKDRCTAAGLSKGQFDRSRGRLERFGRVTVANGLYRRAL